jgi:hypothetical protein
MMGFVFATAILLTYVKQDYARCLGWNRRMGIAMSENIKCTWCGDDLEEEQAKDPRLDIAGDPICDGCYESEYMFTCCKCEEYEEKEYQGSIGSLLVVTEEIDGDRKRVKPGVYEIVKHPFYVDYMVGGHLIEDSLKHLCAVPEGVDNGGYPSGFLCCECAEKLKEELSQQEEPTNAD